jgi:tetratricopeptide (TPR) repeat protein
MIEAAEQQLLIAQRLWDEGKVEESLQTLNLLMVRNPEFGKAHAFWGTLLFQDFLDFLAAEDAFKKALKLSPLNPSLYLNYAALLLRLERYNETVALLNKAFEVPGVDKGKANRLFGLLYERQQEWDEAISYFSKAFQYTFSNDELDLYKADIQRIVQKRAL